SLQVLSNSSLLLEPIHIKPEFDIRDSLILCVQIPCRSACRLWSGFLRCFSESELSAHGFSSARTRSRCRYRNGRPGLSRTYKTGKWPTGNRLDCRLLTLCQLRGITLKLSDLLALICS